MISNGIRIIRERAKNTLATRNLTLLKGYNYMYFNTSIFTPTMYDFLCFFFKLIVIHVGYVESDGTEIYKIQFKLVY